MRKPAAIVALVAAIAFGAVWPWFAQHGVRANEVRPAPAPTDYLLRDRMVAFYERATRLDPDDQITQRMLAGEYLQRFRETGDLTDVVRARRMAQSSLRLQPQGNVPALGVLASSELAFHRFPSALADERAALRAEPYNDGARAQIASILMELGRYDEARRVLKRQPRGDPNPTWMSIRARYDELTGNLAGARVEMSAASTLVDAMAAVPAYTRSWYHERQGQLAFEAGDADAAGAQFEEALRIFPDNAMALLFQAKFYRAHGDWKRALASAARSAELYPLPQALGYQADAERALGDDAAARKTDALIRAEEKLFDVQGINDRLLAMYYAEHREHLRVALTAARADLAKRGDEIYADDTMAWVLAAMHRWKEARIFARRAARYHTEDPELQYHAGVIAWHAGHAAEARRLLAAAIGADPQFHPVYASDARRILAAVPR